MMRWPACCALYALVSTMLVACAGSLGPPRVYSTAPNRWISNRSVEHEPYNEVIRDSDGVRKTFVEFLVKACGDLSEDSTNNAYGSAVPEPVTTRTVTNTIGDGDAFTDDRFRTHDNKRSRAKATHPSHARLRVLDYDGRGGYRVHWQDAPTLETQHKSDESLTASVGGSDQTTSVSVGQRSLMANCDDNSPAALDGTSYRCWAKRHPRARLCADRITRYAIDQCVQYAGVQNAFTSTVNAYLAGFLAAGSLAADASAIKSPGSNNTLSAALAASVVSGASSSHSFIPGVANPSIASMITAEQNYLIVSDIDDDTPAKVKPEAQTIAPCDNNKESLCFGRYYINTDALIKLSRLHDAVYSTCPVQSY